MAGTLAGVSRCKVKSENQPLIMRQIQPLRISKGTPSSSPNKMAGTAQQYPLAEVSPMERRRNSPSFDQRTKVSINPLARWTRRLTRLSNLF